MNDYRELPPVIFTQEQQEAYKEHQDLTDEDGIILWGKLKGVPLDEVRDTDYLRGMMVRGLANAMLIQNRISGQDPETLRSLIANYPQFEGKFRRYYSNFGVTIPPTVPSTMVEDEEEE